MKILFIHEVNWRLKPVFEIHDFPELLSLRGHEISFIDFPEGEELKGFLKLETFRSKSNQKQSRAHKNSSVDLYTPGRICGAPIDRLLHSLTFVPLLIRMLRKSKFEVIILYGVPTNGWQTVLVAKIFRIPVLFRAIDVSHELRKTHFKFLVRLAEKFVVRAASWVSTNNNSLASHCISFGADKYKLSIDYPGLDLVRFLPQSKDIELQKKLEICRDDKVVVFMGTLYRFAGVSTFLKLFAEILRFRPDIKVLILGDGEARNEIQKTVQHLGVQSQVRFCGFVDYDKIATYLNLADVAVSTFEVSSVTNSALPWKVVQYLACGVPTVATPLTGLLGYTELSENCGVIFRELNESFGTAVLQLLDDDIRRAEMGKEARELVVARSSWPECIQRFEDLIIQLVDKK